MDIIKNWGGHIMSVLGILGGLWAYFRHDRKIKSQEKILNDLQIKQMEKELVKERMADMKARIISGYRGNAKIRFINAGKVDAQNVRKDSNFIFRGRYVRNYSFKLGALQCS